MSAAPIRVALATTHHDPGGAMRAQLARALPVLRESFASVVVVASGETDRASLALVAKHGAAVSEPDGRGQAPELTVGRSRREAVALALRTDGGATHVHYCDLDRAIHWAERWPRELARLAAESRADFTVFGRTPRAYGTHPRVQRDTEAMINRVFWLATGRAWDVSAAARAMSRRVAEAIAGDHDDDTIGVDCTWPMFALGRAPAACAFVQTEGLEFETLDRFPREELEAAGGAAGWVARVDADPAQWARRIHTAHVEIAAATARQSPHVRDREPIPGSLRVLFGDGSPAP